jgi:hypothetical protein
MEESYFMMALLIHGLSYPSKDFDVFMEPLVEELIDLWTGIDALEAVSHKKFKLCAMVLWCIHDYPAMSTLYGRVRKGYFVCVRCDNDPCSRRLKKKICYIRHCCFLPIDSP